MSATLTGFHPCECGHPFVPDGADLCQPCNSERAIIAAEGLTTGQFRTLLARAGRNYGPRLLAIAAELEHITSGTLTATIGSVWSAAEFPEKSVGRPMWLELFRRAGFTIDGHAAELPAEPVVLWRGAIRARRAGMAWTADRDRATWFAARFTSLRKARPAAVWQVTAEPAALLCIPGGRGEAEHVIDTRGLTVREASQPEEATA